MSDALLLSELRRAAEGEGLSLDHDARWHFVNTPGEPQFQNSWANKGVGNPRVAFRKNIIGQLEFRGLLQNPAGSNATIAFRLPESCRPSTERFIVQVGSSASGGISVGRAIVRENGNVLLALATASGAIGDFSLEGIVSLD
jgi:hypothetical protein